MMRRLLKFLVLLALVASPAMADNLGSVIGGQAAPQSGMAGGVCFTAPIPLSNGQQAGMRIDCTTHALVVTGSGGTGGLIGIRPISTGASDFATAADFPAIGGQAIFWNSATAAAKTEHLPACTAGLTAGLGTIVDEYGTAGTYHITLTPNGTDTINSASTFPMNFSQQSTTIQCNGSGNWVVQ